MKKFKFNLETVLSIRENIEKEWEAKLGLANKEVQLVKNRISEIESKLNSSRLSSVDISQMQVKCIYEDRLLYQKKREESLLKEKELDRDRVKEVYLQKSMERKVIDKLKDNSLKKYKKESLKEETMFINEINNSSKIRERLLGGTV
ncbi:hypothetical protein EW093_03115 [Thiospirochaeta perfilievii]|uniref:Flagellar FliJ protein n=1 Tax=Thiospirochaeta perfilievii TaxID=252967 RepID=A0A5C1Q9F3_9SPIO|nr:hypothetical protein [Thiospirochaeta perfilievii]QEN03730.1 hypothetical protein EW093_03115 [Thiospirochaeta perfilievii]